MNNAWSHLLIKIKVDLREYERGDFGSICIIDKTFCTLGYI
jgi:hypothetical protein